jgi:hypothetical protein
MTKAHAHNFLRQFEHKLTEDLPDLESLRKTVRDIAKQAKGSEILPHMRRPEEAFLNTYAIPRLSKELQAACGLNMAEAREAILSENFRHIKELSSASPARKTRHPFDKKFASSAALVMSQWRSEKSNALRQSCPDFALRAPCPFTIVFEGKYFEEGSVTKAESELVSSIYQAFFYRALPKVEGLKARPPWDYEFSCLLVCDASRDGNLLNAWESIGQEVQKGFWAGANVYVMVVRSGTLKPAEVKSASRSTP